jgi:hypothetical protein
MKIQFFNILMCLTIATASCRSQQAHIDRIAHPGGELTLLLNAKEASDAIVQDRYNGYFDRITPCEMSIQMKKAMNPQASRSDMQAAYREFLKADVSDFSAEESNWVAGIMKEVYEETEAIFPGLYPDTLWLLKTPAKHVGESVYYTRENGIVIPYDVLVSRDKAAFRSTMYHELFHVISRLYPQKQRNRYALIGFQSIGYDNLEVPPLLAERLLHNPDGVDFAQKIDLQQADGSIISAVPVIYSKQAGHQKGQDVFFSYLEFELFPVELSKDGKWLVKTKPDGLHSPISLKNQPDFFRQIKDNTGYIIHPDEVLADNFAFIVESKKNPAISAKFSEGGKMLLRDLEQLLNTGKSKKDD